MEQAAFYVLLLVFFTALIYHWYCTSCRLYYLNKDINNLYKSRDALWREFNNEVQARKRQNGILRGRIHGLREKLKEKNVKNSIP